MWRRRLPILGTATAVTLLAFPGVATAARSGNDYASGDVFEGGAHWRFSATSNFNGTQPSGFVRLTLANNDPNTVVTGSVTCLRVVGNTAWIIAEVTDIRGTGVNPAFTNSMLINATDSGKFGTSPDTFGGVLTPTPATVASCVFTEPQSPVVNGEVVVSDALS